MNISKLKNIIKEELQKLLFENVVCDTRNNHPMTGASSTCPPTSNGSPQTCTANSNGDGYAGTCGPPASVTPGGGTPTGAGPIPQGVRQNTPNVRNQLPPDSHRHSHG